MLKWPSARLPRRSSRPAPRRLGLDAGRRAVSCRNPIQACCNQRRRMMSNRPDELTRRQFVRRTALVGAVLAAPSVIPGSALGRDGAVAPSERIVLGGIGLGPRGTLVLNSFLT